MFEGKKHFEKTNSKHRSPLWKPFSGCVTAIAETIRGWFPARRGKKKARIEFERTIFIFNVWDLWDLLCKASWLSISDSSGIYIYLV